MKNREGKGEGFKLKCRKHSGLLECNGVEVKWFALTLIGEKEEEEEEVRVLQGWTPLCRNSTASAAPLSTSHRYSCTKQNKLPIPALFFSSVPLLREGLHDSSFSRVHPKWGQGDKNLRCATTNAAKYQILTCFYIVGFFFINDAETGLKGDKTSPSVSTEAVKKTCALLWRNKWNALLLLSLLAGAFATWCRRLVVITRLSLSYHYISVPPALVCQLSSVIRYRAATGQALL